MDLFIYILSGAAVGLAVGVTGIGGGSLMTPLLILLGIPYNIAIGTDLLYAALTKTSGMVAHHRHGHVRWDITGAMLAGSIPAALITALLLKLYFSDASEYQHLLTTSLGFMLIGTALVLLFKKSLQASAQQAAADARMSSRKKITVVIMGFWLGIFVTLTSVGAGALGTAILIILFPSLAAVRIIGTDIAHAVPLTLVAGLGHLFLLGNVDLLLLGCLLIGSLPAVQLGAKISTMIPPRFLQSMLASLLIAVGVKFALF